MSERIIQPIALADQMPESAGIDPVAALAETEQFVRDVAPHLGRLFGMDLKLEITELKEGAGMAADPESGTVLVDPRFFFENGKTSPDEANYGIMHETAAHIRSIVTNPDHTQRVNRFAQRGKPQHLFNNIFEDIAGNNLIHAVLPRMGQVATQLYGERLFRETDYTEKPRHTQFLYKIIRQEMVPEGKANVLPEVDLAIDGLRNFEGKGDVIKYSTAVAKSATERMSDEERFKIWTGVIYPVYERLLEQDRQDPNMQEQGGQAGDGQPGESGEGQQQSGSGSPSDDERFGSHYADYAQNRHPEPMGEHDHESLHVHAKQSEKSSQSTEAQVKREQEKRLDERIRAETGHSLREKRHYDTQINRWRGVIDEMRQVYATVINERIAQKRVLSRRPQIEGAVLHPDRLAQTFIDLQSGLQNTEAFRDYRTEKGEAQAVGKTDYVFLLDVSISMQGESAAAAAASTVIALEGLAALQRDIESAEAETDTDLELDIRTAIYTFGDEPQCLKPLSTKLSDKERLDAYAAVSKPNDGSTQDFLALEGVLELPSDSDRRKILIAVSDGGSNGVTDARSRARSAVEKLRQADWFVYGISIGSDEAETLYRPTARRLDDPKNLPETIAGFIEDTIR